MPTVLLVEDSEEFAAIVRETLRRIKVDVYYARDGRMATEYLRNNRPDLILLDLNLPDMSGTDILARVKGDERLRRAPVVVLTTTDDKVEIQRCYDLGCNVYITKPVNYENFAQAIRQLGLFLSVMQSPDIE